MSIKHPMSIYCCHVQDIIWKVAKFQDVKNKAPCKRFLINSNPLPTRKCLQKEIISSIGSA